MSEFAVAENDPILELSPMNRTHRRIARLLAHGITPPEISGYIGLSEMTVQNYARRPETEEMIQYLDVLKRKQNLVDRDSFDELQSQAIKVYEEALDDPKLSTEAKVRIANQILDRHPEGTFTKASKLKHEGVSKVTNEAILELKRRAHMTQAEVLDITPLPSAVLQQSDSPAQVADPLPRGSATDGSVFHVEHEELAVEV